MPNIWMDVDTALPEVPVNILALIDDGDFKTREESVTFDQAGLDLLWNFVTTAGIHSQTAVTPTDTAGDYDWVNQGNGMYTIEIPLSGGASINNDAEGFGWFSGFATGILPWSGPVIGFRAAGLNNLLVDNAFSTTRGLTGTAIPAIAAQAAGGLYTRGTGAGQINQNANGQIDSNPVAISGDTDAADKLELQYDGTGLDGASFPARQDQVNNIGSGATGGTHVEATYDNTTRDTIDNAPAVDKGGGLVGIPVTGHSFVVGREVTIAGTVNYNGAFEVISQTTNEVVITDTFVSETFGGSETIVSSIKGEIFVGTITSGTFADTAAPQGTLHSMDDDGDVIKIVYGFNIGGSRQATDIGIFANVNGNTDEMIVKAFNFVTQQFEPKRTLPGSGGTAFIPLDPPLVSRNTGTGTEIGDVFIFLDTVTTTPSSLDVDLCLLTAVGTNLLIGYPNGFEISAAGTSGTEFGVNGTAGNPCPFADALTMNAGAPLNMFTIHNGETITLSGNSDGFSLTGETWTLDLSDESIANMHVRGATVSGGSTGSGSDFHDCEMGTVTIAPCAIIACRFTSKTSGGFTMQTAGNYIFHGCGSRVAGNDSPVFTFPGAGNTFISDRAGSGGRQYEGMSAGDLASVEGWGQFVEGTCSGGAVTIRGCLTTSGISNITITDEARFDVSQITGGEYSLDTDVNGRVRIVDGTGVGELNTDSGRVESDLVYIHGTALTETSGQIAAAFVKLFDVATPLLVASDVMVGTDGANTTVPDAAGTAATLHSTTDGLIGDVPTVAEFNARTIPTANYFDPTADTVVTDGASRTASKADVSALALATALTTVGNNVVLILADTGTDGVVVASGSKSGYTLTSTDHNAIADALLQRNMSNVEATAGEHTLCTTVLAMLESSIASTTWTIKRTDGSTTHATKTVTVDSAADPITGVS